eukprot:scaffold17139_cov123-Isochrysis_galbana.AAC.4
MYRNIPELYPTPKGNSFELRKGRLLEGGGRPLCALLGTFFFSKHPPNPDTHADADADAGMANEMLLPM